MKRAPGFQRKSIQCPRCHQLISLNSDVCINCGLARPGLYTSIPVLGELLSGELSFVNGITLACFSLYVLALTLDVTSIRITGSPFAVLSPSSEALYRLGMGGLIPWQEGRWWSFITATYLHGGILHIAFNMLWLRRIGALVEELFGASRFWIIYTLSGLFGALVSFWSGTLLFVGASGSIFGLLGALIYYGRSRGGVFGSSIFRQMAIWAAIGFVFGLMMPGVDNWGHIGGFAAGILLAWILQYNDKARQSFVQHILACAILVGVMICFGFMFVLFF